MIVERFILGMLFIFCSVVSYFWFFAQGSADSFGCGGTVVGLFVAGISYMIFSFESSAYLKRIEEKKSKSRRRA